MKNKIITIYACYLMAFHTPAFSTTVEVQGSGQVKIKDSNITCSTNCEIDNSANSVILLPEANDGWEFSGWQGNQCSWGEKVLVKKESRLIDKTQGGAKTLGHADVNGDGKIDLASISLFYRDLAIHINNGNGDFEKVIIDSNLTYPTALDFYDWDGDGDADIILSDFGLKLIRIYQNDGNGNFAFQENIEIDGYRPYSIAVTDVNSDQNPDLVISSFTANIKGDLFKLVNSIADPEIRLFINESGTFTASQLIAATPALTIDAVYDAENGLKVVAAEIWQDKITMYSLDNQTVNAQEVMTGGSPYGASFGDIDQNGTLDVIAAFYSPSNLKIAYQNLSGQFDPAQTITEPEEGLTATVIADLNDDGLNDFATGEFNNDLFYYFESTSYLNCGLDAGEDTDLIAVFSEVEKETSESGGESEVITPKNESSGGTLSLILGFLLSVWVTRRTARVI